MAHIIRYILASQFVKNRLVLDSGCGTGYGTSYLAASGARFVIGVDYSKKAIGYAIKHNRNINNVRFIVMDSLNLDFKDNLFDVIVSFEVIEHVKNPEKFIKEINRVLREDGTAIVGTPNRLVSLGGNPHHIHEFEPNEFKELIDDYFTDVKLLGKDLIFYGRRAREKWWKFSAYKLRIDNFIIVDSEVEKCFGLLAICKSPK